jgi:hypothetical protein
VRIAAADPVSEADLDPEPWRGKWMSPSGIRWSRDWYGDGRGLNPAWDGVER